MIVYAHMSIVFSFFHTVSNRKILTVLCSGIKNGKKKGQGDGKN